MKTRFPVPILDAKKLFSSLLAIRKKVREQDIDAIRSETLDVVRAAHNEARSALHERFLADGDASRATRDSAALVDLLIRTLFQFAGNSLYRQKKSDLKKRLAIIAVGGYGRNELFPYSDIDLLFLHATEDWEQASKIAEFILYILWDLGMQVGQSVRTVEDTLAWAQSDATVLTNLLEMRFICGNKDLLTTLESRYWDEVATEKNALAFVEAKLKERDDRHQRGGDSRYVLEPKLKEGKGGLRDLQTLHWLARYVYRIRQTKELVKLGVLSPEEYRAYRRAKTFLGTVRVHMHLLAGRPEERLTFDMQRAVAERMGYRDRGDTKAVERFMKAWFLTAKTVGDLTRVFCAVLEDERKHKYRLPFPSLMFNPWKLNGFITFNGRLAAPHEEFLRERPLRLLELFALAQKHDLDIHPRTLRYVSRLLPLINRALREDKVANDLFLDMLTSPKQPEITLRRMNEAGVLGKFIPDFGRVVGQMQFDMYHIYTVDEHTIFALGMLNQIRQGQWKDDFPLATKLIHRITSYRMLCLAVFCHDIAKGRGGDHSVLGERVARKLAQRMGFDAEEVETAAWLVRYHLLFSRTAFKRDITEDKTIADFVEKVQSPERLRALLILTVVDIRAVGPQVWNSWKGALLRDLYFRALEKMGAMDDSDVTAIRSAMLIPAFSEGLPDWSPEERAAYLALGNEQFFKSFDVSTHIRLAHLLRQAEGDPAHFAVRVTADARLSITEVLLAASDRKGLFSLMAGALTSVGANIVNAKIFTLKNSMAVEQFYVQDFQGHVFDDPRRIEKLKKALRQVLDSGEVAAPPQHFGVQHRAFSVPPRVIIENTVSAHHTVIEINGRDRPGFLHTVTRTLADLELGISTAHVSSYGERAVDVFYVKDKFGMKITSEPKLKQVREGLQEALKEPEDMTVDKAAKKQGKGVQYV